MADHQPVGNFCQYTHPTDLASIAGERLLLRVINSRRTMSATAAAFPGSGRRLRATGSQCDQQWRGRAGLCHADPAHHRPRCDPGTPSTAGMVASGAGSSPASPASAPSRAARYRRRARPAAPGPMAGRDRPRDPRCRHRGERRQHQGRQARRGAAAPLDMPCRCVGTDPARPGSVNFFNRGPSDMSDGAAKGPPRPPGLSAPPSAARRADMSGGSAT